MGLCVVCPEPAHCTSSEACRSTGAWLNTSVTTGVLVLPNFLDEEPEEIQEPVGGEALVLICFQLPAHRPAMKLRPGLR